MICCQMLVKILSLICMQYSLTITRFELMTTLLLLAGVNLTTVE